MISKSDCKANKGILIAIGVLNYLIFRCVIKKKVTL